jgi:hypothetical protein
MASAPTQPEPSAEIQLERSTYEIIRNRLDTFGSDLRKRLDELNLKRRDVFGAIPTELISTERVTTDNNCVARDIVSVGNHLIFGYNVHIGLRSETTLSDVFAIYQFDKNGLHAESLDLLSNPNFEHDFKQLYKYYKTTKFAKFQSIDPHLYIVFQVGKSARDIKAFKFLVKGGNLEYIDNRSEHEAKFPPQHDFEWTRTHRDLHRAGDHPHISIQDRVFVETVGGDLTIKIEDNTADGVGIYNEPVDDPDQTLDDAEIFYSIVGNIILLKIRPYKEEAFRYLVFNEKTQQVVRLDAIADACVQLPEDHGVIFSRGYYLQTGDHKYFDNDATDLLFEKRIASPNGEDYMFVFFNRETGLYVLLMYNVIEQKVATPILCHGFSLFDDGRLVFFKTDSQAQKHHALQVWQTPFVDKSIIAPSAQSDSMLYKIGNAEIVRGMAECHEVINLLSKDDTFANLYVDIVKKTTDVIDAYFWISDPSASNLGESLLKIREAAKAAVDEFDKVVRVKRNTKTQFDETSKSINEVLSAATQRMYQHIDDFVKSLADLRRARGEAISLKELKYVDLDAVEKLEHRVQEESDRLSHRCVEFLLREDSLAPYEQRVQKQHAQIGQLDTVAHGKKLDEDISNGSSELEMLIDIVSNLKIDDATERTRIIDNISTIYSNLNQTRATLKKHIKELQQVEGAAEFHSQLKLLSQAVVNYLDICDSPERCDEYLTKMMVQVEELEGRFVEFDEFVLQLAEKREEIYAAFDSRRLQIVESRNRRATALMNAADRILKGIKSRIANFDNTNDINSYFASDLMIEKVRDITKQLAGLDESVKVDDIQSRLKSIREDAVQQLRDKKELFVEGENTIRLGKHLFSVNVQPLELTTVLKDDKMFFHLSGTKYLEEITDQAFLATRPVWNQEALSENKQVYRGEYLAYLLIKAIDAGKWHSSPEVLAFTDDELALQIQQFMAPRYSEGYVKGVHNLDAAKILRAILELRQSVGMMRYHTDARALGTISWYMVQHLDPEFYKSISAELHAAGAVAKAFKQVFSRSELVGRLQQMIHAFLDHEVDDASAESNFQLLPAKQFATQAAQFLYDELTTPNNRAASQAAIQLAKSMLQYFDRHQLTSAFESTLDQLQDDPTARYASIGNWIYAYLATEDKTDSQRQYLKEAAAIILDGSLEDRISLSAERVRKVSGLIGNHVRLESDPYELDLAEFEMRLDAFASKTVPAYEFYIESKKELLQNRRNQMRLDEFKPRVLTSFVRNKLINDVYLHLVGANLAKQIGEIGENKRTDLMGLLLLVSPPGYGKTTLMEYIANRLGITFMKINGPAIGHRVTSLDPVEAPNASAREEVEKLNLALEMGDNVMIYVDDIQHCHPEFLQKFISLCDATRRIEGVWRGQTRTYDLRGRKVCVVMAGNPYTESGDKFQIPDMLANRADVYNLGDVIGDTRQAFELSYLENCLTSNSTLSILNSRSRNDIYSIIKMAELGDRDGIELEGNYSIEEINEFVAVMKKLIKVRNVLLKVNELYIESAAQADAYRTEPAFKLQGSYRDMNKIAERIVPVMNEEELDTLIYSHYENQAQTLTTGAEANLLKFKELIGKMNPTETARWEDIKRTFKRNVLLGSVAGDDKFGQVIAQMSTFSEGLADIRAALSIGIDSLLASKNVKESEGQADQQVTPLEKLTLSQMNAAVDEFGKFNSTMHEIKTLLNDRIKVPVDEASTGKTKAAFHPVESKVQVINKVPTAFMEVIQSQFRILQTWLAPILALSNQLPDSNEFKRAVEETVKRYENIFKKLERDPEKE